MKIALYFDNNIEHTTGNHVFESLLAANHQVTIFNPRDEIVSDGECFDLLLSVDYGVKFDKPKNISFKKSAIWLIDTHLHFVRYFYMSLNYDYIYCAQKKAVEKFNKLGIRTKWLPLAYSNFHHTSSFHEKKHDLAFIGNPTWGIRKKTLEKISSAIKKSYIGNCDFRRIGEIYSSSYLVFNISINDDLNMRFFEGIASGSFLKTDLVQGLDEIIGFDERYSYSRSSLKDLNTFIDELKKNIEDIKQGKVLIDQNKLKLFLSRNSYCYRVEELLRDISDNKNSTNRREFSYFKFLMYIFIPEIKNSAGIFFIRKIDGLKNRLRKFK